MKRISKYLAVLFLLFALGGAASADTFNLSSTNPNFSNNRTGTVTFRWVSPVPPTIEIYRYNGGWNSRPSQELMYSGPAPASLILPGGGTRGGGRYTIKSPTNARFQVQVSGTNAVVW